MKIVIDCLINVHQKAKDAYWLDPVYPIPILLLALLLKLQMKEVFVYGKKPIVEN